jgi:predicted nucleic acid-binding protein
MRVFLDANILFSAAVKNSATAALLGVLLKKAEAVTNLHAWEEASRNIDLKRPDHAGSLIKLKKSLSFTEAFSVEFDLDIPDEDVPVLAGAIGSKCTHLWTGDKKHFGKYFGKTIGGVRIVSGVMLADELFS